MIRVAQKDMEPQSEDAFIWDPSAKANLYYIHFHLEKDDVPEDIKSAWWRADYAKNDKWMQECTSEERYLAMEFTEYERIVGEWNENGNVDFETAINAYIEIKQGNPKREVRFCTECGMPMNVGYYLFDAYACSDECRNAHYKRTQGCKDDDEAEHEYLWDCYELGRSDMKKSEWMAKPIDECRNYSELVGDTCYYTEWI